MIAPGATGDYHTKLSSKAETLVKHLTDDQKEYTFGFLHVKAVDDAGHDKNVPLKVEFLERIDREVWSSASPGCRASQERRYCSTSFRRWRRTARRAARSTCWLSRATTRLRWRCVHQSRKPRSPPHCVQYGDHSCEPVPFALTEVTAAQNVATHPSDVVSAFSEIDAAQGILGRFPGGEVMALIKRFLEHLRAAPQ